MSNKNKISVQALGQALTDLIAVERDARDYGFDWPDVEMILDQSISECEEVRDALLQQESADRLQEEVGDVLHTAIALCMFLDYEIETILSQASNKFAKRMVALKQIANERGLDHLRGKSIDFMLELWREAKIATKD